MNHLVISLDEWYGLNTKPLPRAKTDGLCTVTTYRSDGLILDKYTYVVHQNVLIDEINIE